MRIAKKRLFQFGAFLLLVFFIAWPRNESGKPTGGPTQSVEEDGSGTAITVFIVCVLVAVLVIVGLVTASVMIRERTDELARMRKVVEDEAHEHDRGGAKELRGNLLTVHCTCGEPVRAYSVFQRDEMPSTLVVPNYGPITEQSDVPAPDDPPEPSEETVTDFIPRRADTADYGPDSAQSDAPLY